MTVGMLCGLGILGVIVGVTLWVVGTYNRIVRLKALVDEAWSGIDVQLKRRYDLIPNIVSVVKGYSVHEKAIFESIAQARAASMGATRINDKLRAEAELTQTLKTLFAVVENYPDLKANQSFLALQKELSGIEEGLQLSRRYYNGAGRNYNVMIASFPATIVANNAGFEKVPYFELSASHEREVPTIQF